MELTGSKELLTKVFVEKLLGIFFKMFSNFLQVIEHYKSQGEPASLMATTSGAGRIGEKKAFSDIVSILRKRFFFFFEKKKFFKIIFADSRGESSYAQNSFGDGEPGSSDDQSDIESIMRDHSDDWWNIFALCGRVFRYVRNSK